MLTQQTDFSAALPALPLMDARESSLVFFDIETTGFKAATSRVYLIGAAFHTTGGWRITQWLCENLSEEEALLRTFAAFLRPYKTLAHFNGTRFDIPYLEEKYASYGIPSPLGELTSIDLYRDLKPLRALLGLTHMNQKSLEAFLGIQRKDRFDGGALIDVFRTCCETGDETGRELLLLHNLEDVQGMLRLTDLYAFHQAFAKLPENAVPELTVNGDALVLTASHPVPFPIPVNKAVPLEPSNVTRSDSLQVVLQLKDQNCTLTVPVIRGTMLHFFEDYRNYYYLPLEDEAIHKSVASFVDRQFRKPATARTCYTKKAGRFIPAFACDAKPCFKRSPEDSMQWILLPDHPQEKAAFWAAYLREAVLFLKTTPAKSKASFVMLKHPT